MSATTTLSYYRWPIGIVGFLLFVICFDVWFISVAARQHAELIERNPYEKGLAYQQVIDAAERKDALGWRSVTELAAQADGTTLITLRLSDRAGLPLNGGKVALIAIRPSDSTKDLRLALVPAEAGAYSTAAPLQSGLWLFQYVVEQGESNVAFREQVKVP